MNTLNQIKNQKDDNNRGNQREFSINGNRGMVRLVRQDDVVMIDDMHDRVSKDSIYYRYLGTNKPSMEDLSWLCSHGCENGVVFVAEIDEPERKIIGLAFYICDPKDPTSAEPAVLIEDRYQRCGLGKKIMSSLYNTAASRGIRSFISYIHPANLKVLRLIESSGLEFNSKYTDGLKRVTIKLSDTQS
jgi:acetyltransferase